MQLAAEGFAADARRAAGGRDRMRERAAQRRRIGGRPSRPRCRQLASIGSVSHDALDENHRTLFAPNLDTTTHGVQPSGYRRKARIGWFW